MRNQVDSNRAALARGGRALLAAVAGMLLFAAPGRGAAPKVVAVEDCRVGFDGRYKVGTWTPVFVLLRGGPDGFDGELHAVVEDENGTPTTVRQVVQVPPGGTQRATCYVRPGSLDANFGSLRFHDPKADRQAAPEFVIGSIARDANSPNKLEPIGQRDYQLVTLGHPQGVDLVAKLPGFNANPGNAAANGRAREVAVTNVSSLGAADRLPGRWLGYDSAEAVVVDTNDAETMAALNGGRAEAIRQWVERGGHLIVAVSGRWQAVVDGPLGAILPAKVVGQAQVSPFDALESFTGASHHAQFENVPAQVARFEEVEARGGRVIASTLSTPLVVRGPYGFGRVTLVGIDVDAGPFAGWPDRNLFWVKAIDLKAPPGISEDTTTSAASQRIFAENLSDLATVLRRALDQFRGMTVIPFGYVAGFIALYILLIGPGDYFFLKKVLKRMELTWITFPTIVVVVSLLAYLAAYRIKGTDLRVNQVEVVDVDLAAKVARGTTWVNLFSPQNRDYSVRIEPRSVVASDAPAAPGTETVVSWFAAPEAGLRGMNSRGQGVGFAGAGYTYAPPGRAEALDGVRVGIWSTKGFVARWFGPAPASGTMLDVDLAAVGTDRLAGTVTNRLPYALRNVVIAFGKQVYHEVGTIEPGATADVDPTRNRNLGGYLQAAHSRLVAPLDAGGAAATIDRASLVRELMFHDSAEANEKTIPSRTHHDLDLTGQLALDRPMLVAEVDHPGAVLDLGADAGPTRTERTTLLRIILPLKPEANSSTPSPSPSTPKGPQP